MGLYSGLPSQGLTLSQMLSAVIGSIVLEPVTLSNTIPLIRQTDQPFSRVHHTMVSNQPRSERSAYRRITHGKRKHLDDIETMSS